MLMLSDRDMLIVIFVPTTAAIAYWWLPAKLMFAAWYEFTIQELIF